MYRFYKDILIFTHTWEQKIQVILKCLLWGWAIFKDGKKKYLSRIFQTNNAKKANVLRQKKIKWNYTTWCQGNIKRIALLIYWGGVQRFPN